MPILVLTLFISLQFDNDQAFVDIFECFGYNLEFKCPVAEPLFMFKTSA